MTQITDPALWSVAHHHLYVILQLKAGDDALPLLAHWRLEAAGHRVGLHPVTMQIKVSARQADRCNTISIAGSFAMSSCAHLGQQIEVSARIYNATTTTAGFPPDELA